MGAFNKPSGNLVSSQDLFNLGLINAATPKTKKIKVPSSAVSGVAGKTKLTATLKIDISILAGAAQKLTIEVQNLTTATGNVIKKEYTAIGFYEDLQIPCFGGDELQYDWTYSTTVGNENATTEEAVLVNITSKG